MGAIVVNRLYEECQHRCGSWSDECRDGLGYHGIGYGILWVRFLHQLFSKQESNAEGSNLYSTFITPWADQSAARTVEPDFHIPQCYQNVHAPPPGPAKAVLFSDETLFFMFYSSPRDALQEVAAQEL